MSTPRLIALALALALIALVLLSPNADAATFYIDPDCATPGDGTSDTCSGLSTDPFDNWTDVTWTAGNSYFQKAGTIANETAVTIQATGTAGNVITMGAYDVTTAEPYAKINCASTGVNGVNAIAIQYATVQDFEVYGCTSAGIKFRGNNTLEIRDVTIRRVYVHDNTTEGVQITNQLGTTPAASVNLLIEDCTAFDNGSHGCAMEIGATNPIIRRCIAARNSHTSSGWGCYLEPYAYATAQATLVSGTLYQVAKGVHDGVPVVAVYIPGRANSGPFKLTEGTYGALSTNEWAEDVANETLQIDVGSSLVGVKINVVLGTSTTPTIEDSTAYAQSDAFDGNGIGCDTGTTGCLLQRNIAYDNPGKGISCHICDGSPIVRSNIAFNNGLYGITMNNVYGSALVTNNTAANNTTAQLNVQYVYTGDTVTFTNNIEYGGVNAILAENMDGGTLVDDYSLYFSQSGTAFSGVSAGSNSTNSDPLFSGAAMNAAMDFTLQSGSPAVRAGTCVYTTGCIARDYYNRAPRVPPDIGAIQRKASD